MKAVGQDWHLKNETELDGNASAFTVVSCVSGDCPLNYICLFCSGSGIEMVGKPLAG